MPITLEPFVRFTCFNFHLKALDSYFHPGLTSGASDPTGGRIQPPPALTDNPAYQLLFTYQYYDSTHYVHVERMEEY